MRDIFTLVFVLLIVILGICSIMARRSSKSVAKPVSYLLVTFIVPITGNMILTLSQDELLSTIGSYTYFIGMTLMAFSLFDFTLAYCGISWKNHKKKCYAIYALLVLDIVQYLFNPFFGHAFNSESVFGAGYKRCAGCVCVNKWCVGFLNKVVVTLRRYVRDDVEQEVGDVSGQC